MHSHLNSLPQSLLNALGRGHSKVALAKSLSVALDHVVACAVPMALHASAGLDLMVQCSNPDADEAHQQWGLHSFTLQAKDWPGPWPQGVDAESNSNDVARAFEAEAETAMVLPNMACFTVAGLDNKNWTVLCSFTQCMQSLSLIDTGPWILDGIAPT